MVFPFSLINNLLSFFSPSIPHIFVFSVMKLFEGGILDKITNDEFEKMYQKTSQSSVPTGEQATSKDEEKETKSDSTSNKESKVTSGARDDHTTVNLRMLQGSFYLVLFGHLMALLVLLGEIECHSSPLRLIERVKRAFKSICDFVKGKFVQLIGIVKRF